MCLALDECSYVEHACYRFLMATKQQQQMSDVNNLDVLLV